MNRRQFASTIIVFSALGSSLGCFFSNVYKNIDRYVPLALLAFDRIIEILTEHGIPVGPLTDSVNRVKAAIADIVTAVLAYREASGDKSTAIAMIRAALQVAQQSLEEFWRKLSIPNPALAGTIRALIGIIMSTLAGFEAQLPTGRVTPQPKPRVAQAEFDWVNSVKLRSISEFREDFNSVLRQNGEEKYAI